MRHFETTTNSGHEGTNNGIKAGPVCVLPQHGIDKSVKIQVDTDSNKFDLYQRHMASALFGRATWSNSPTVNDVTLPAEFMLKYALEQCESYASWRTSPYKWLVVRSVDRDVHSLIPCFHRVYTVTSHEFDNTVCLMCDCNYFECNVWFAHIWCMLRSTTEAIRTSVTTTFQCVGGNHIFTFQ